MIHLNRREKRFGIAMASILAVWAVYGYGVRPARQRIATLQRVIPEKQNDLALLRDGSAQYRALQQAFETTQRQLARQDERFELLPFLETLITDQRLDEHLVNMKPDPAPSPAGYAETSVTVEFKGVRLRPLLAFLEAVETADAVVRIASLHLRRESDQSPTLAATIRITSPRPFADSFAANTY